MTNHTKKMIAPIVIVLCITLYFISVIYALIKYNLPDLVKIIVIILSILVTLLLISVLAERIKEIREGEEDDLGKY